MVTYRPLRLLNKNSSWFGVLPKDIGITFVVFMFVAYLLTPFSLQIFSFFAVPIVIVPLAIIRRQHRDKILRSMVWYYMNIKA
jgi:hypothetical protein